MDETYVVIIRGRAVGRAKLTDDNTLVYLSKTGRVSLRTFLERSDDPESPVVLRKPPAPKKKPSKPI